MLSKVNSPFAKACVGLVIGIVIFWRTSSASRNRQSVFSGLRRLLVTVSLFLADFVGLLVVVSLFWWASSATGWLSVCFVSFYISITSFSVGGC